MPLARVKTWNPGDTLTAADLNAEFNNILNNPISLISNATSLVAGDVLVASTAATPVLSRLAVGSRGQVLAVTSSATMPTWVGPFVGSRVSGLFGSFSSQVASFTARQYLMQTTDGRQSLQVNATSSFSVNIGSTSSTGPAAGGRDVAAAFSSTFAYFYAISTGAGSTAPAGVASTVPPPTGPIMPTSYSAWSFLGGIPYSSASTLISFAYLSGSQTRYTGPITDTIVLSSGTATTASQIVFSSLVPPNAVSVEFLIAGVQSTLAAGSNANALFNVTSSVSGTADAMHTLQVDAQVVGVENRTGIIPYTFPFLSASSQGLYYLTNTSALSVFAYVAGFKNPNGGE